MSRWRLSASAVTRHKHDLPSNEVTNRRNTVPNCNTSATKLLQYRSNFARFEVGTHVSTGIHCARDQAAELDAASNKKMPIRAKGDLMLTTSTQTRQSGLGTVSATQQPMLIETSWHRSRQFGLSERQPVECFTLSKSDLRLLSDQNRELMHHASPVMETLHEQIVDSESVVVLTDAQGTILRSIGDDSFSMHAAQVAIRPGVTWSESQKGTNAIGTAIYEQQPVTVHGNQHFLQSNHFLTCSATPIFAPAGDLLGILDVTGDYRGFSKHTMGLVRMSAQMIENALFRRLYAAELIVAFHARPEFIGTLMEGLVAFAPDGKVLGANRSACMQLELPRSSLGSHTAISLFRRSTGELHELAYQAVSTPLQCVLPAGVRIYAVPTALKTQSFAASQTAQQTASAGTATATATADQKSRPPAARPSKSATNTGGLPQATLDLLDSGDPQIAKVVARLRRVACTYVSVLLEAETGAGKEWFSLAIHRASERRTGPFVAVNCAAIPEGLIESELFGYEDGAFTGAKRKGHQGKILQANGGTLFLDEIGDMPLAMQARLLRVLQERVVTPLGSSASIPVDVRLICATHQRLRDLIQQKQFRDDLYYRLNGLTVRLPSLRDRSDVKEIVTRSLRAQGGPEWTLAADVWQLMLNHPWPGNLRQLSNVLATAIAIATPDTVIRLEHLPDDFLDDLDVRGTSTSTTTASAPQFGQARVMTTDGSLDHLATEAMQRALTRHHGNVSAAARELGVSRNTLYRKLPASRLRETSHPQTQ
jgi:sigma-54 dependent transcriptional regulator, acetoin dehydrogenase operon transcriptional activator AcoR